VTAGLDYQFTREHVTENPCTSSFKLDSACAVFVQGAGL
jgi:hypothetical protein